MFAHTNAYEAGGYFLDEMERLSQNPHLTDPAELSLLLTQTDLIAIEIGKALQCFRSITETCRALALSLRNDQPSDMLRASVDPMYIRGLRRRKTRMYLTRLTELRELTYSILDERCRNAALAREWPAWVHYRVGYVRAWILLATLDEAAAAYRLGFSVDPTPELEQLITLLDGPTRRLRLISR